MTPFGFPLVLYLRGVLLALSDPNGYNRFTKHSVIVYRSPGGEIRYGVERKK